MGVDLNIKSVMLNMRVRTCMNFFAVLTWMSVVIYSMLAVLLDLDSWKLRTIHSKPGMQHPNPQHVSLMVDMGFFNDQPRYYPDAYFDDGSLPVFVATVSEETLAEFSEFLMSFRSYFRDKKLVVYNLGMAYEDRLMLMEHCRCQIRDVRWERYPPHVHNLQSGAYRPILMQEALVEFGAVFWCDNSIRFYSFQIYMLVEQAKRVGLVSWPILHPTSTLTHYNMFRYLNVSQEDYFFHRMVESGKVILFNTPNVHKQLMLPWVKCALEPQCISPQGAQGWGCNFNNKPKYLYSGCHKYDMSAFNVILGQMFKFDTPYIPETNIFKDVTPQKSWFYASLWNWTSHLRL